MMLKNTDRKIRTNTISGSSSYPLAILWITILSHFVSSATTAAVRPVCVPPVFDRSSATAGITFLLEILSWWSFFPSFSSVFSMATSTAFSLNQPKGTVSAQSLEDQREIRVLPPSSLASSSSSGSVTFPEFLSICLRWLQWKFHLMHFN